MRGIFPILQPAAIALSCVLAAGCSNNNGRTRDDYQGVGQALDDLEPKGSGGGASAAAPGAAGADVPGVDVSKLDERGKQRFAALLDRLQSPCGSAHSLRKSLVEEERCKRAPFAARYVVMLVDEDLEELEIRAAYDGRYRNGDRFNIDIAEAPYLGSPGAPVQLVEFFDYGCPHCAAFRPVLEEIAEAYPGDVVVYFKQFPLGSNTASEPAARAALAAHRQGKFAEMHAALLANQSAHSGADLLRYAQQIGLDMPKFQADLADKVLVARVAKDKADGLDAGVEGTPTLFFNGREYTDPLGFPFLKDWIDEHLAVNR